MSAELARNVFGEKDPLDLSIWLNIAENESYLDWLWSFELIRKEIFDRAGIQMLHINQQEAAKHLERMQNLQNRIRERAQIERK